MDIQKVVLPFYGGEAFTVSYMEKYFDGKDTAVKIYDKYKISILLSDGLNAVKGDRLISCEKYGVLFFRPDELHFGHFTHDGIHSYLDFFIPVNFFEKFNIEEELLNFLNDTSENRINYIPAETESRNIANEAVEILINGKSEMNLFSALFRIVLFCGENYEKQKNNPTENGMPAIVIKTIKYISESFAEKISLKKLAVLSNCSVAYLSRVFKKYTGTTVYNYITATRIANAKKLLNDGFDVTETCFFSGFEDCSNFIKTFKSLTGKTPLQYKKEAECKK